MSSELNLNSIDFQQAIRSKPIRENFTDIQNEHNLLRNEFYASVSSTASEVTNARGGFSALVDNVNIRHYGVATGGIVEPQSVANNTVKFTAGSGATLSGAGVKWIAGNSSIVSAVTKPRWGVACINSDSSFSIEWGATATTPTMPSIANSQIVLASVYQNTASPPVFSSDKIVDMRASNETRFKKNESFGAVRYSNGANIQVKDLFSLLNKFIPFTNDSIASSGYIIGVGGSPTKTGVLSRIVRNGINSIYLYVLDTSNNFYTIELDSTSTSLLLYVNIAW